ncbi:RIP metalloprotease RseP [Natranaerobius thermophilus]|uniref:Zinc metalloprotease n=1 Tax=Natranaerobius thermophilus (strain ATCC BAA-1301 / DSM 18059 / JW/NM-WN-LF) TaxID=457570 RepID=B2A389_NATTJ|nr:RIP metalloprotease RseP [Natranaerobius thermophilus]ACB85019.1 membrane-associated zinc metalloprotease [Natranaerobius thermophilus JW/NM-WN-LF]
METLIYSIIIFGLLIFMHEFGHFIIAKLNKVSVLEFAMGFGPKLVGFQKGETKYSLRIIPLGGYCRMKGEDPDESDEEGSFLKATPLQRIAILAAGSIMNFVLAIILLSTLYGTLGVPGDDPNEVGHIVEDGVADEAGIEPGDEITRVNDTEIDSWEQLVTIINENPGEELELSIHRNGDNFQLTVVPEEEPETGRGLIGITNLQEASFFAAIRQGAEETWWFTTMIFVGLYQMITGQIEADVAGPVGIVHMIGEVAETGLVNLLPFAAFLSINLGILNLLPIPALDGSRIIFSLVELIRGRPVDPTKENFVHFIGFAFLIMLMFVILYNDLMRLEIF